MEQSKRKELQLTAAKARLLGVQMVHDAASGHPGGSMSCMDVLTYLYFAEMHVDPKNPHDPERDRFVMSKGHCSPAVYPTLALRGFFPVEDLKMFRRIDGHMSGHVEMKYVPGVDMSTGSLGQGISTACGMALGAKLRGTDERVYTLLGDGEIQEGQVWEALMFAAHRNLDNLVVIIDNNGLQIDGPVGEVMSPYPIPEKLRAFGFECVEIDGHNFDQIDAAFTLAKGVKGKPFAIVMKTVKGKGVSFMENQVGWHGTAPNAEQYETAMAELRAHLAELEAK